MSVMLSGIDLVEIAKFKEIFARHTGLLEVVFTDRERQDGFRSRDPWKRFAAGFAVKEACLKALGMGFLGVGIDGALREVEAILDSGKARLFAYGWLSRCCARRGIERWAVSVSYSARYAVAAVVAIHESTQRRAHSARR